MQPCIIYTRMYIKRSWNCVTPNITFLCYLCKVLDNQESLFTWYFSKWIKNWQWRTKTCCQKKFNVSLHFYNTLFILSLSNFMPWTICYKKNFSSLKCCKWNRTNFIIVQQILHALHIQIYYISTYMLWIHYIYRFSGIETHTKS